MEFTLIIFLITIGSLGVFAFFYRGAEWGSPGMNCFDGMNRLYCRFYHGLTHDQLQLPATGPAIVIANHVSGLDPVLLQALSPRPLRFLVAKEEYERPIVHYLMKAAGCIPVDRQNNPQRALREALLALKQGEVIAIFPHGGIAHPVTTKRPLKGGAIRLAQKVGVPLHPVIFSNVMGAGFTLLALFFPGRVKATFATPVSCVEKSYDECMNLVAQMLNNPDEL